MALGMMLNHKKFLLCLLTNYFIDVTFLSPILVDPGTYFHVILKIPIAATPTVDQYFRGSINISGFFE